MMYEVTIRSTKNGEKITQVLDKGILLFDVYKGVNRLTAEQKRNLHTVSPDSTLALPEDIQ